VTPRTFAKSVGFAKIQVRYVRPSARQVGGDGGRSGQCEKAALAFRQHTRCSGVLRKPHEHRSLASRWLNFV
jgi:hypothetical protein